MKLLICDNASITLKNNRKYTNALNGLFIDELIACGNDLTYFQFCGISGNNISSFDLEEHGVYCVPVKMKKNRVLRYLCAYIKAWKCIKDSDFVYIYYPNTFRYLSYFCRLLRKPYGLYIRGMNGLEDKISYDIYKHAYTIFTVSDHFTNMVNRVTQKETAHTIRPMIPYTDADVVTGRTYESREVYNILFLGRIAKDKGLAELVNAAKQLRNKGYKFIMHIVGNGEFSPQLAQLVSELDLKDTVLLEGPVYDNEKKASYYKEADLYVLPTYHEGFPRTLYEAMIFGAPIVTTFVGGIPALMKDGVNCKQIEPHSVNSIVNGLTYALENYSEMGVMANCASDMVREIVNRNRLTHAQHLNQLLELYGK